MTDHIINNPLPLAGIRRIPDSEKKPGVQKPFLYTDEGIVAMGGSLERLNRYRQMMKEFKALHSSPKANKKRSRA